MEKLQPILAHKFWIIAAVALLLPVTGWMLGTGEVSGKIEEDRQRVEQAFNLPAANSPNPKWAEGLENRNGSLEQLGTEAHRYLWGVQRAARKWPEPVNAVAVEEMGIPLEKVPAGQDFHYEVLDTYRLHYRNVLLPRLEDSIVEPFSQETGTGKVNFSLQALHPLVPRQAWQDLPPATSEVRHAQEDLWFFKALLGAIADVNSEFQTISDAPIRSIQTILLRGGDAAALQAGGTGAAGDEEYGTEGAEGYGGGSEGYGEDRYNMGSEGAFGAQGGEYGQAGAGGTGIQIDLDSVFGPDRAAGAGGGMYGEEGGEYGGEGGNEGYGNGSPEAASSPGQEGVEMERVYSGGADGGIGSEGGYSQANLPNRGGAQGTLRRRYVDDRPDAPYKTRGFYLELVMDQRALPELMVALANQTWPVQILRVQFAEFNGRTGGSSGYGPGGGEGYAMGQSPMATGYGMQGSAAGGALSGLTGIANQFRPSALGQGQSRFGSAPQPETSPLLRDSLSGEDPKPEAVHAARILQEALSDPYLVHVAIAGKLTIFRAPAEASEASGAVANGSLSTSNQLPGSPASPVPGNAATPQNPAGAPANQADSSTPPAASGNGSGGDSVPQDPAAPDAGGASSENDTATDQQSDADAGPDAESAEP